MYGETYREEQTRKWRWKKFWLRLISAVLLIVHVLFVCFQVYAGTTFESLKFATECLMTTFFCVGITWAVTTLN